MKKNKEEILEKVKDSMMIQKIVNEDIKKHQAVEKAQIKHQKQLIIWKKNIRAKKSNILWLAYKQGQIFENSKWMKVLKIFYG